MIFGLSNAQVRLASENSEPASLSTKSLPNVIVSQAVDYAPSPRLSSSLIGRYVGESYLDNTNNDDFTAPSFTTVDGTVSYALTKAMRLTLQVNNLLNNDRIFPNGYVIDGYAYYYPQATRNFMLMVDFDL